MAETRAILYGFWASSCSWRVRAALRFKNVPYDERAVDLLKQNQLSDEYKTINPAQKVPSLIIGSPLLNVPGIEQFSELKRLKKETKINLDTTIDTTRWRLRNAASRSSFHYNSLFLELDFPNEHWENLLLECKLRAGGTENLFECSDSYNYGQTSLQAETRAILYGFWASSCSWRVRAALRFKNVPYDERAVDLLKQNQLSDEYKTINPAQKVPSLIIGSPLLNVPGIEQFSELKRLKKETKINLDTTIDTTRWRLRNAASRSSFHYNSLFLELDFPNEHWENLLLECKLRAGGTENLFECSDSYNYGQTSLQVINYLQTEKGRLKALRLSEVKDGFISFGVISMSSECLRKFNVSDKLHNFKKK